MDKHGTSDYKPKTFNNAWKYSNNDAVEVSGFRSAPHNGFNEPLRIEWNDFVNIYID